MNNPIYEILEQFLSKHKINIHLEELELQLSSHSSFSSLQSITGVLNHFGIPNMSSKVSINKKILSQLPSYFIANVSKNKQTKLALIEKNDQQIKIYYNKKEQEINSQEEFLNCWNGAILAIEKDENIAEKTVSSIINVLQISLLLIGCLFAFQILFTLPDNFARLHFLLSIIGMATSILIIQHELGIPSNLLNKICHLSKQTQCDTVLDAKNFPLLKVFKLSDLSLIVFGSYLLNWFLCYLNGISNFTLVAFTSLSALPFIAYAFYQQRQVAPKWCLLCLAIASILILQIGSIFLGSFSMSFDQSSSFILFSSFMLGIIIWYSLRPLLEQRQELKNLQITHHKLKRNPTVFNALYQENLDLVTQLSLSNEIILGNPHALTEIILVSNPLCYHCKQAYAEIVEILKKANNQVKVILRFMVNTSDTQTRSYRLNAQLFEKCQGKSQEEILQILEEVYAPNVDFDQWLQTNQTSISQKTHDALKAQDHWYDLNDVISAPTLYVNRKYFPDVYNKSDLLYFLEDLKVEKTPKTKCTLDRQMLIDAFYDQLLIY